MFDVVTTLDMVKVEIEERVAQAEQQRLAIEARGSDGHMPFYAPLLAKVGETMVKVGSQLQEHYATLNSAPANLVEKHV
jgi:hypothetical protein